jgi:hypothetical protein
MGASVPSRNPCLTRRAGPSTTTFNEPSPSHWKWLRRTRDRTAVEQTWKLFGCGKVGTKHKLFSKLVRFLCARIAGRLCIDVIEAPHSVFDAFFNFGE